MAKKELTTKEQIQYHLTDFRYTTEEKTAVRAKISALEEVRKFAVQRIKELKKEDVNFDKALEDINKKLSELGFGADMPF